MARQSSERNPGKLSRGHVRYRLIRELASQEKTQRQLAREFGCHPSAITQFKQRHAAEIAQVRADLDNEFAGLWVTRKAERLAEYMADIERIGDGTVEVELEGGPEGATITASKVDAALIRAKQAALRAVAEEMGQIPSKVNISVEPVTLRYEVAGVDPEVMK